MGRRLLLAALALVTVSTPASARRDAECLVGFEGVTADAHGRVVRHACAGACEFTVSACVNGVATGCAAAPIERVVFGNARTLPLPVVGTGDGHACGTPTTFRLEATRRPRTVRLRVAAEAGSRRDQDRLLLICRPNPTEDGCASVSSTTTLPASTTSTTESTTTTSSEPASTTSTQPSTTTMPAAVSTTVTTSTSTSTLPTSTTTLPLLPPVDCAAAEATLLPRGRLADFPPSVRTPGTCIDEYGFNPSNYALPDLEEDAGAAEEVHVVVAPYGPRPEQAYTFPQHWYPTLTIEPVSVRIKPRPKPVALVIQSSNNDWTAMTRWTITLDPGARLSRVIAMGDSIDDVVGVPAGVPMERVPTDDPCAAWPVSWETDRWSRPRDYAFFIAEVRRLTGRRETSFQGCTVGNAFSVPYWDGAPPTARAQPLEGSETLARERVQFPGCESVTTESAYCLTIVSEDSYTSDPQHGTPSVVGLDSGRTCAVAPAGAEFRRWDLRSIAWRGEFLYGCNDQGLIRTSLRDGRWEVAQIPCDAVAGDERGLLVRSRGVVTGYGSYDDVVAGRAGDSYPIEPFATFGVGDDRLFWISFEVPGIESLSVDSGLDRRLFPVDPWPLAFASGLAGLPDGSVVMSSPSNGLNGYWDGTRVVHHDGMLHLYDAADGDRLCDLETEPQVLGLSCVSRRTVPSRCALQTTTTTIVTTTTTTTLPEVCPELQPVCCYTNTDACVLGLRSDPLAPDLIDDCQATGGTVRDGVCAAPCGAPAGCCRQAGCAAFALFGDVEDLRDWCEAFWQGEFTPGECPPDDR